MNTATYNYSAWWADRLKAQSEGVPFTTPVDDVRYLVGVGPTPEVPK